MKVKRTVAGFSACCITLCPAIAQIAPSNPSEPVRCVEERAQFAVGEAYSEGLAERAREAAGARLVRKIEPGGAYTMDLRADRLNVEVDRLDVVQRVACG